MQERDITRFCRWNRQRAVPGAPRGAPLRPSFEDIELKFKGCEIAVEKGIVYAGVLPSFLQLEVLLEEGGKGNITGNRNLALYHES